jgi:hypothetical protein
MMTGKAFRLNQLGSHHHVLRPASHRLVSAIGLQPHFLFIESSFLASNLT